MKPLFLVLGLSLALPPRDAPAQSSPPAQRQGDDSLASLPPDQQATHRELIAFRVGIEKAFNTMGESGKLEDLTALLEYAHPDIVFTAMTGESVRGRNEIIEYFKRDYLNPGHTVKRMHSEFSADHLSILLRPDVATNRGVAHGTFGFTDGSELKVDTRWTATLVKENGRWLLAAFHFSPSIFDNPVVDAYKAWIYKASAIAGVAALLIGLFVGRWIGRPRAA